MKTENTLDPAAIEARLLSRLNSATCLCGEPHAPSHDDTCSIAIHTIIDELVDPQETDRQRMDGCQSRLVRVLAALLAELARARAAVEVAEAAAKYRDAETTFTLCKLFLSNRKASRDELREATEAVLKSRDALDAALARYRAAKAIAALPTVNLQI